MSRQALSFAPLAVAVTLAVVACAGPPAATPPPAPDPQAALAAQVARGEYLVTVAGCNECHTPWVMGPEGPQPDATRLLSGHPESLTMPPAPEPVGPWIVAMAATNTAFAGPWGVSYAPNLTPDASGMAAWTEEIFVNAIRSGRHWGQSRPILPPMPWQSYAKMTDEDLAALFAYLRSIPLVVNHVPDPVLAPPPAPAPAG